MTDDLKPCPFCGSKARTFGRPHWGVVCETAQIRGGCGATVEGGLDNEASATAAWNRRAPDPALLEAANALSEVEGEKQNNGSSSAAEHTSPDGLTETQRSAGQARIYVASRASLDARPAMWRALRDDGWPIISTWIDEAAAGQTECLTELWSRIEREVTTATALIFYAEPDDFPLKGAYVEIGMAMAAGVPIAVVAPGVLLEPPSYRPVGSWVTHASVRVFPTVLAALDAVISGTLPGGRSPDPALQLAESQRDEALSRVGELKKGLALAIQMIEAMSRFNPLTPTGTVALDGLCSLLSGSLGAEDRLVLPPTRGGGDEGVSVAQSACEGLRPFASDRSCQSEGATSPAPGASTPAQRRPE